MDFSVVAGLEQEIRDLRVALADLSDGVDEVDPHDQGTLECVDGLRRVLEAIYGQPIVFHGEIYPTPDSVVVEGTVVVDEVRGFVAGLRARKVLGGSLTGRTEAKRVESGGTAVGVEIDSVG